MDMDFQITITLQLSNDASVYYGDPKHNSSFAYWVNLNSVTLTIKLVFLPVYVSHHH